MYENNPQTIGELKAAITGKIRQIPKEKCVRVIDNFVRRNLMDLCRINEHFYGFCFFLGHPVYCLL